MSSSVPLAIAIALGAYSVPATSTDGQALTWNATTGAIEWRTPASGGSGITTLTGDVTAGPGSGSQAAAVVAITGPSGGGGNVPLANASFTWAASQTPIVFHSQNTSGAGVDTTWHTQAAKAGSSAQGGNFRVALGKIDGAGTVTSFFAVASETAVGGASTDYLRVVANAVGYSLLYDNGNSGVIIATSSAGTNAPEALIMTRSTSVKLTSSGPITLQPNDGNSVVFEGNLTGNFYWTFSMTNGGANSLTHVASSTSVTYKQADNTTASATAAPTTVQAQNATGATSTGGALNLTSGTGTTIAGALNLQFGGTTLMAYNGNGRTVTSTSVGLSSGTTTLSAAQAQNELIVLTGTLTGATTVVVPNASGTWFFDISALSGISGTNTLTFKSGTATTPALSSLTTTSTIVMISARGSNTISINV